MHPLSPKLRADSLSSIEDLSQLSTSTSVEFSLSNKYVRGTLCFLSQLEWTARDPVSKKAGFSCSVLNSGSCFISQDEGMSEYPVETLENAIVLCLFWIGGITSF